MKPRLMHRWTPVLALVALGGACDSPTEPRLGVPAVTLEAIGDAAQLVATNAGDRLPNWESLDETVATVTPAGMVVAVGEGTATVRARLGSRTAEGTVTVLPPVELLISELAVVTDPQGAAGTSMRLINQGGRGYFRLEFWREAADGETEHQRVLHYANDSEAPVGLNITHQNFLTDEPVDWVIAYSREPRSTEHRMTSCVRMDGGTPCPMP